MTGDVVPAWIAASLDIAGVVGALITAILSLAWWWLKHTHLARGEFHAFLRDHGDVHRTIEERLAKGEGRFGTIDGDMRHRPDQSVITELRSAIAELTASVRELHINRDAVDQRLEHMEGQLDRLIDYQLRGRA